mgnify:CR=1 FL=1
MLEEAVGDRERPVADDGAPVTGNGAVGSWLLLTTNVYDPSVRRQQIAPKKVYAIDTGLTQAVGYSASPNTGHLLENVVFLAQRRLEQGVYYWAAPAGQEVDFYVPERKRLIQVSASIDQPATRERELRSLDEGMRALDLKEGLLLANVNVPPVPVSAGTIHVQSIADWLLSPT